MSDCTPMLRRIRTSRPLEYACVYHVDFRWLAEGLVSDHSTLAECFSKFRPELKSLFKPVCRPHAAMSEMFQASRVP